MESGLTGAAPALLRGGEEALLRGAWREARESFDAVLAQFDSPEALIGIGVAARYQFDAGGALGAHESAFRLARERGDARLAGRAALELGFDCGLFRGPAEMGGWLERAARLLEGVPAGYEQGLLTYLRARYALDQQHDPGAAGRLAREGIKLSRLGDAFDGEMACLALEGLAMVADGRRTSEIRPGRRELTCQFPVCSSASRRYPGAPALRSHGASCRHQSRIAALLSRRTGKRSMRSTGRGRRARAAKEERRAAEIDLSRLDPSCRS